MKGIIRYSVIVSNIEAHILPVFSSNLKCKLGYIKIIRLGYKNNKVRLIVHT